MDGSDCLCAYAYVTSGRLFGFTCFSLSLCFGSSLCTYTPIVTIHTHRHHAHPSSPYTPIITIFVNTMKPMIALNHTYTSIIETW